MVLAPQDAFPHGIIGRIGKSLIPVCICLRLVLHGFRNAHGVDPGKVMVNVLQTGPGRRPARVKLVMAGRQDSPTGPAYF